MKNVSNIAKQSKKASAFTLLVSFICIALVGLALIPLLPVKLNPSRTLPGFSVQFSMPGTSARVIEIEATSKLEAMLSRIKGVKNIYSTSGNGWGRITIDLDKYADTEAVRFEASTIIRQTWPELPDGISYPYIYMKRPDDANSRPFMSFTLNAPSTPILIQQYAETHIKTKLAQLQGIYKIDIYGATPMEWRLEYDSRQLSKLGVTLGEVAQAIQRAYQKDFLGVSDVKSGSGTKWIRLALVPDQANAKGFDPSGILVKNSYGKIIRLDELVKVVRMEEEPTSYYRINGLNSIYLSITAEESVNQLKLGKQIGEEIARIQQILPAGYEIHTSYDATEYIHKELDKIYLRSGLTLVILLMFVLLITFNPRYLFLIVVSLSINLAIAVIFYYLLDLEMQLYSLAGITVSLNLILDNTIVMTDHYLRRRNVQTFVSILAATLTTMGALVIIFFLDEKIRLNLQDFAAVVIINLAVSLFIALFFVPSMIEKIGLKKRPKRHRSYKWALLNGRFFCFIRSANKRFPVYFTRFYCGLIRIICRWKIAVCLFFLLLFGLPVFMLPEKIEKESDWAEFYNKTIGSDTYKEKFKPIVNKALGGTLRLFVENVYEGSYFTRNDEVTLYVLATMPNGSTLEQMNALIKRMEIYLSQFKEIKQFQTSINNARDASISIYFKKQYENSGFPYTLKSDIISKALQLGGGSWAVYGLQDQGFSNDVSEIAGSYQVKIAGYNYDELYHWAEQLKAKLLEHRRIKEVIINSEFSWKKDDYHEFFFKLDKERMAKNQISAYELFAAVRPIFGRDMEVGVLPTEEGVEKIKLSSKQSTEYDIWMMQNAPYDINGKSFKLADLATVEKEQAPQEIKKENQQYVLCLQYEYIGSSAQGSKILERDLKEFNAQLPMGYQAETSGRDWYWNKKDSKQYWLLLVVVVIIFFITSILFNSLKQPLAIIFVIPVSYIGVFSTFYWFDLNFDQGGFASFILLCGITVNASIYILNEYNAIRSRSPRLSILRAYTKAWNNKIIPIFLTIVSTILGFIPFMIGEEKEAFWFPLAAGTIGGLLMSVVGVFIFLPVLVLRKKDVSAKKTS